MTVRAHVIRSKQGHIVRFVQTLGQLTISKQISKDCFDIVSWPKNFGGVIKRHNFRREKKLITVETSTNSELERISNSQKNKKRFKKYNPPIVLAIYIV